MSRLSGIRFNRKPRYAEVNSLLHSAWLPNATRVNWH